MLKATLVLRLGPKHEFWFAFRPGPSLTTTPIKIITNLICLGNGVGLLTLVAVYSREFLFFASEYPGPFLYYFHKQSCITPQMNILIHNFIFVISCILALL